ncbi:hypothetical protein DFJ74DRAFT_654264 [Hyaloraphidium curvatum]|nr:hypothetical protein DFJ74DRAFT_654264 [Hyaloraphidium curvatum]
MLTVAASPGVVHRPAMLAVFVIDVGACPVAADALMWATRVSLAVARVSLHLKSADPRLEVAVDVFSTRERPSLAVPRLRHSRPDSVLSSLPELLVSAVRGLPNSSRTAGTRLEALDMRLRALQGAAGWDSSTSMDPIPAQSPLTAKHRGHGVHKKPLSEQLTSESDRVGVLKRLKAMPPSAVRHHVFVISDVPTGAEWFGGTASNSSERTRRQLQDALLGKDGINWATWTDFRVALSWLPLSPPPDRTLEAVVKCLGGCMVPLPWLTLPETWVPSGSVFGPKRPRMIERELGRVAITKGIVPVLEDDEDERLVVEAHGRSFALHGTRLGSWESAATLFADSGVPSLQAELPITSSPDCPAFIMQSIPDSFPSELSFSCDDRTFSLHLDGGVAVLLAQDAGPGAAFDDRFDEAVDLLRCMPSQLMPVPGRSLCTSPLAKAHLRSPQPYCKTPLKKSWGADELAMEEDSSSAEAKNAADLVKLYEAWYEHAASGDEGSLSGLAEFLNGQVPALQALGPQIAVELLDLLLVPMSAVSEADTIPDEGMVDGSDLVVTEQSFRLLSASALDSNYRALETAVLEAVESQGSQGDALEAAARHCWATKVAALQAMLLLHLEMLRISLQLEVPLPQFDEPESALGREGKKAKSRPRTGESLLKSRIDDLLVDLRTEIGMYDPPITEESEPEKPPVDLELLRRLVGGYDCLGPDARRWWKEIKEMIAMDAPLEDAPVGKPWAEEEPIKVEVVPAPIPAFAQQERRVNRTSSQSSVSLSAASVSLPARADSVGSTGSHASAATVEGFLQHRAKQRSGIGGGRMLQIDVGQIGSGRMPGRGRDGRKKASGGRLEAPQGIRIGAKSPFKPIKPSAKPPMIPQHKPQTKIPAAASRPKPADEPALLVPETPAASKARRKSSAKHTPVRAVRDEEWEVRRHTPDEFARRLRGDDGPVVLERKRKDRDSFGRTGPEWEPEPPAKAGKMKEGTAVAAEEVEIAKVRKPKGARRAVDDLLGLL